MMTESDWKLCESKTLALFIKGQQIAAQHGLLLVDTKYEFGKDEKTGEILLIDEVHTPDSSRFWKADTYEARLSAGNDPENFDKEFVRIAFADLGYRGDGEIPQVPVDLWVATAQRYIMIYEMLTGLIFEPGKYPIEPRLLENLKKAGIVAN